MTRLRCPWPGPDWRGWATALAGVMVASAALAADTETTRMRRELSETIKSQYRYGDAAAPRAKPPPDPASAPAIVMPQYVVTAPRMDWRNFESAVQRGQQRDAPRKAKWGCGPLVSKDFGKVRMSVISIFYVPVFVGFSW
jgi:hypothetical protein